MSGLIEVRRAGFEAAWLKVAGSLPARYAQGMYVSDTALIAWNAYNAALDLVVVELPCQKMSVYANQNGYNCAIEAIQWSKEAIHAAGVRTK